MLPEGDLDADTIHVPESWTRMVHVCDNFLRLWPWKALERITEFQACLDGLQISFFFQRHFVRFVLGLPEKKGFSHSCHNCYGFTMEKDPFFYQHILTHLIF